MGGLFSQFVSWRWIFLVNVPLCLAAGWMLLRAHRETVEKREHRIDYAGAATLTVALTALILAVLEGGNAWAWLSAPSLATFAIGMVALVVFVLIDAAPPSRSST